MKCDVHFINFPWALLSDKRALAGARVKAGARGAQNGCQERATWGPRLKLPHRFPLPWGPPGQERGPGGAAPPGLTLSEASLASGHETGSEMVEKCWYFPADVEGIRLPSGPAGGAGSPRNGWQGAGSEGGAPAGRPAGYWGKAERGPAARDRREREAGTWSWWGGGRRQTARAGGGADAAPGAGTRGRRGGRGAPSRRRGG